MSSYDTALAADPEVAGLIGQELNRQQTTLAWPWRRARTAVVTS